MGRPPFDVVIRRSLLGARPVATVRRLVRQLLALASAVPGGAAVPVGLIVTSLLVWQTSYAAFTATTSNGTNSFASGTVSFGANDPTSAMFTTSDYLRPGTTASSGSVIKCLRVRYTGVIPAQIKIYGSAIGAGASTTTSQATALADLARLQIEISNTDPGGSSPGASSSACPTSGVTWTTIFNESTGTSTGDTTKSAGSLSRFASHTAWSASIATGWTPRAAENRIFRFTAYMVDTSDNTLQGKTATTSITWEAQNT